MSMGSRSRNGLFQQGEHRRRQPRGRASGVFEIASKRRACVVDGSVNFNVMGAACAYEAGDRIVDQSRAAAVEFCQRQKCHETDRNLAV